MATAEDLFGVSRPNLIQELEDFYNKIEASLIKARPSLKGELKFGSTLPLHHLPFSERADAIADYRRIIGLDESLNTLARGGGGDIHPAIAQAEGIDDNLRSGVGNIYRKLKTTVSPGSRNPYGRFTETSGSMLSEIYSRINLQFRSSLRYDRAGIISSKGSGATAASHFTMGLDSIPARSSLTTPIYTPGMLAGKSILTYDVETAGLSKGQIREVAYSKTTASGDTVSRQLLFSPKEFDRGIVAVDGRATNLREFMRSKFDIRMPDVNGGKEFADGMESFLREVIETDYVVGHNISRFDNEQVFVGLSRTSRYRTDKEFASLVDTAFEKVKSSTIDTMSLVRQMPGLSDIQTAAELSRKGSTELFSISNLLLNTDLSDRIGMERLAELMGYEDGVFKYGLHHAGIDTEVTSAILQAAEEGGLKLKRMGAGTTGPTKELAKAMRAQIVSSSAITPFTNIGSVNEITDPVLKFLVDNYNNKGAIRASRGSELDKLLRGSAEDKALAIQKLRAGELTPTSIRLSPIEQQILTERRLGMGIDDAAISSGDVLGRMKLMQPGRNESNARTQVRARRSGLAFAGLSSEERGVAYGVSVATSDLAGLSLRETKAGVIGSDTLVSRFKLFDPEKVQYVTRSGRASMPIELLQEAGVWSKKELLSLSFVEGSPGTNSGAVNVVKSLDKKGIEKLKDYLTKLNQGTDEEIAKALGSRSGVENFRSAMKDGDLLDRIDSRGVSVAQLFEGDNAGAVSKVRNVFRQFFNVDGQIDDRAAGRLLFPAMEVDREAGILRTAGAVFNTGINRGVKSQIFRAVEGAQVNYGQTLDVASQPMNYIKAKMAQKIGNVSDDAIKAHKIASEVIPHLGKGALGLAAAGIGAVLFNRHQETKVLDQTMEFQGYEASGQYGVYDQIQEKIASGYQGYENLIDPLATASLTTNLNYNRVTHSDYSWDRNNAVYGGVL